MEHTEAMLDLKRQVEEVSDEIRELSAKMDAQYTDVMILLQKLESAVGTMTADVAEVNDTLSSVADDMGEVKTGVEEVMGELETEESTPEDTPEQGFALYEKAKDTVIELQCASVPILQKTLHIGYVQASRLIDELEEDGVIGPSLGEKPREVLWGGTA